MEQRYWMVVRGDDAGNRIIIGEGLDEEAANTILERVKHGHKQFYEIYTYEKSTLEALEDKLHLLR